MGDKDDTNERTFANLEIVRTFIALKEAAMVAATKVPKTSEGRLLEVVQDDLALISLAEEVLDIIRAEREACAQIPLRMIVGGRAHTEEQAEAARMLGDVCDAIRQRLNLG